VIAPHRIQACNRVAAVSCRNWRLAAARSRRYNDLARQPLEFVETAVKQSSCRGGATGDDTLQACGAMHLDGVFFHTPTRTHTPHPHRIRGDHDAITASARPFMTPHTPPPPTNQAITRLTGKGFASAARQGDGRIAVARPGLCSSVKVCGGRREEHQGGTLRLGSGEHKEIAAV
jgi:hypothetical protein